MVQVVELEMRLGYERAELSRAGSARAATYSDVSMVGPSRAQAIPDMHNAHPVVVQKCCLGIVWTPDHSLRIWGLD